MGAGERGGVGLQLKMTRVLFPVGDVDHERDDENECSQGDGRDQQNGAALIRKACTDHG